MRVSAYKARTNLGDLINRAYYNDEVIIIERKGEPMVKIVKYTSAKRKSNKSFLEAAGILKDLDTDKMIEYIYEGRRDGSRNKKFLADWDS
ncbi:MAG: hypothetical protein A3H88_03065 [Candidatus Blackburnbacteria bacterium RIFCSPLOWO2_02_FULL_44_9]|uniref:Antitoxin n=1 Tax=Candidatus Blackburnbacteria bacterium RIFCSPHIGHO2_02_FULL_44_20 TaxID=1797516 RepID=A0A1G1V6V5_9BACT|nr:MAG: hypothetical protein A3B55_02615 [Candidatus Daviesbacteria bacterium RIFCSPLOWO2_01_FULL_43_15]OGY11126.1 MAG: hypothetical protein A3D26_02255 [Candidatus Blackburnbacteria bacterium RIFCSPHIGHO2_02_FULL_44_20]OGY17505.1 MAG: hypothetical protein A3H88_03065 [Candidatus Blackburnbacteria bacterium RIFCSPLOWO2_02_FULL_44_9]